MLNKPYTQIVEEQMERFEKMISPVLKLGYPNSPNLMSQLSIEWQSFLSQAMQSAREATLGELLERIGEMKKTLMKERLSNITRTYTSYDQATDNGFNSALSSLTEIINNMKNK